MAIESKINKRNMVIMGLIGFFLGLIVAMVISVGSVGFNESPNTASMIAAVLILTVGFGYWGSQMKHTVHAPAALNQDPLTKKERMYVLVFSIIHPVITGAVAYFMYRKSFPGKARQANTISFIVFIPWFLLMYGKSFFQP